MQPGIDVLFNHQSYAKRSDGNPSLFVSVHCNCSHEASSTSFDEHRETTTFTFDQELPKGPAVFNILFQGILNDKMAGFYRSSYKDAEGNAKVMGVTQFEATEARRAFPCWDEPAVKATFSIKLCVPSELVALSNMPVEQITAVEPEEMTYHFEKTPIMSTYVCLFLFA